MSLQTLQNFLHTDFNLRINELYCTSLFRIFLVSCLVNLI